MTLKQISTLHYILGRLEGLAEGLEQNQQQYLLDTCEILDGLLREETKECVGNRAVTAQSSIALGTSKKNRVMFESRSIARYAVGSSPKSESIMGRSTDIVTPVILSMRRNHEQDLHYQDD